MRSLHKFFIITYLVSWTFFGAASIVTNLQGPLFFLGAISPSFVALSLTGFKDGRAGIRALTKGMSQWPAQARWYVFAIGYMAAIKLSAALLHRLVSGEWPQFGQEPLYIMALAIVVSTPVQAGEEIGWRAFALPRLASRLGLGWAGIVLGVIWACWHLPLFFIPNTDSFGQSFPVYLINVTAISIAMTWLYWRTNQSLLLVMLLHASINNTTGIVPGNMPEASPLSIHTTPVGWFTVALLWICAVYFLIQMRQKALRLPN